MRKVEREYRLTPVQGRHFELNGDPLPANSPIRPRRRAARPNALGAVKRALGGDSPFSDAVSWEDLDIKLKVRGIEIKYTGTRIEIGPIDKGPHVPAEDLFRNNASLERLEKKFGDSYANWMNHKDIISKATAMGLSTGDYILWLDEQHTLKKVKVRKAQMVAKKRKMVRFMEMASRPAREARAPSLYPESNAYYGPALSRLEIAEAVEHLPEKEVRSWHRRTIMAIKIVENTLKSPEKKQVSDVDLKDSLIQMGDGLKTIEKYAENGGIKVGAMHSSRTTTKKHKGLVNIER